MISVPAVILKLKAPASTVNVESILFPAKATPEALMVRVPVEPEYVKLTVEFPFALNAFIELIE